VKIKEPFLLITALCWIVLSLVLKEIRWRGTYRRMEWSMRIALAGIGFAMLLLWYSLPAR
jgi:hypothetical protein